MKTMHDYLGRPQVYEGYTVTVTYEVRALRDEWGGDGWTDEKEVLEAFIEEFDGRDHVVIGFEAGVTDYKIERDE